jgi:hypothetical protein
MSLTHPPAAPQSAATASTIAILRFNTDMTGLTSRPGTKPGLLMDITADQYFATTGPPNLKSRPSVTTE